MIGIGVWVIVQAVGQLQRVTSSKEPLSSGAIDPLPRAILKKILVVLDDPFIVDPECSGNVNAKASPIGFRINAQQSGQWRSGRHDGFKPFSGNLLHGCL